MNYFEFYGLPLSFYPDQAKLKALFFENSRKYHPDFFTQVTQEEQAEALKKSSYNNEAFRTLKNDDKRLHYILTLTEALNEENKNAIPQEFLMEMMDLNESVMELQFDYEESKAIPIMREIEDLQSSMESEVSSIMQAFSDNQDPSTLAPVKDYYLKSKYLMRLRDNISKLTSDQ